MTVSPTAIGNTEARTPHIDSLARGGLQLSRHC